MKKFNIILASAALIFIMGSCKKSFFDINKNPNSPTAAVITPDLALAAQLKNIATVNASTWDYLHRWMGYWSASGSYSPSSVEWSYNITNDFGSGLWNDTYYIVGQLRAIQKKAHELDWKFYEGISMILEAHQMQALVDAYGNVPYTQAFNLGEYFRPVYDDAEEVYKKIFALVDDGMGLIKDSYGNDQNIGTIDVMFKGDKTKWLKFGNTLKLKMMLHTVKANTFNVSTEMAKITSEGSGFLGNGVGAVVQPGFSPDKPNPYYNAHFYSISGTENDNYNRANDYSLTMMKDLGDERYKRVYRPAKNGGAYKGTVYGSMPTDENNSDNTSGVGYGITANASAPMWIMSSTEAMFLRAEAVLRGWITGDAEEAYKDAVRESFKSLAVPDAVATADLYLAGANAKVAWPASGTETEKMTVLMWQKYFALNGIQANETWVDYRRLGLIEVPLSIFDQVGSNKIPLRLLYPTSEYNYNTENVQAQGTINPQSSALFWDK